MLVQKYATLNASIDNPKQRKFNSLLYFKHLKMFWQEDNVQPFKVYSLKMWGHLLSNGFVLHSKNLSFPADTECSPHCVRNGNMHWKLPSEWISSDRGDVSER